MEPLVIYAHLEHITTMVVAKIVTLIAQNALLQLPNAPNVLMENI